jgi:hypothetical protein
VECAVESTLVNFLEASAHLQGLGDAQLHNRMCPRIEGLQGGLGLEVARFDRDFEDVTVGGKHVWDGFVECSDLGKKVQVFVGLCVLGISAVEVDVVEQPTLVALLQQLQRDSFDPASCLVPTAG